MSKYVVYTRVSTIAQGESHLGLDAQVRDCKEYVSRRKGKIVKMFEEVASGSKSTKRPLVLEAIDCAQTNNAVLLVARLDRLGRSQAFLTSVRESGVKIESVEHGAMGTMLFGIYAAISEHERELISNRTKAGLAQAKKNGVKLGRCTWGDSYKISNEKRRLDAETHHKQALNVTIDSRKAGESYETIASKLERYNIRTQTGCLYTPTALRKLMSRYSPLHRLAIITDDNGKATSSNEHATNNSNED